MVELFFVRCHAERSAAESKHLERRGEKHLCESRHWLRRIFVIGYAESAISERSEESASIRMTKNHGEESTRLRLRGVTIALGVAVANADASTALSVTILLGVVVIRETLRLRSA